MNCKKNGLKLRNDGTDERVTIFLFFSYKIEGWSNRSPRVLTQRQWTARDLHANGMRLPCHRLPFRAYYQCAHGGQAWSGW
ncbi:hypothetical protein Bpfe_015172, partial [Biomphalaria pfeifferi]